MELLYVFLLSVFSFIVLFLLTKLIGDRQISQMSMLDYIIGITIGSIAAEMATSLEADWKQPLLAMTVYAVLAVLTALVTNKWMRTRPFLEGKPRILLDNGKLNRENFKKARLDLNEFLMECRKSGYFDLSELQTAILEANGAISFLPRADSRPTTPSDFNMSPQQKTMVTTLIMDGKMLPLHLKQCGLDENWLTAQLKNQGIQAISAVFLATVDQNNQLSVYPMQT